MRKWAIEERVLKGASLITKQGLTLRQVAEILGVSKSTVHLDATRRLPLLNGREACAVRRVLDEHLNERAIRGGLSTKLKWKQLRTKGGW